jgi:hypothetical protein
MGTSALTHLRELAAGARSGELVVSHVSREVHVFLSEGRVAWATDSVEPALFSRLIKQRCAIPEAAFTDVVSECRRSSLPLGETLITLGLASAEQVRAALEEQARATLRALGACEGASYVFLERPRFATYRHDFTFALRELLAGAAEAHVPAVQVLHADAEAWLATLRATGADWACFANATEVKGATSVPHDTLLLASAQLRARDARLLAFQNGGGTVVGVDTPHGTLWAHSTSPGHINRLTSTLFSLGLVSPRADAPRDGAPWRDVASPALKMSLEQVLALGPDLHALRVETEGERPSLGVTSSAQHLSDLAAANKPLFDSLRACCGPGVGFGERLIIATATQTLFALHETSPRVFVWVLAGAACSLGMGLASLSFALRNLPGEFGGATQVTP